MMSVVFSVSLLESPAADLDVFTGDEGTKVTRKHAPMNSACETSTCIVPITTPLAKARPQLSPASRTWQKACHLRKEERLRPGEPLLSPSGEEVLP